MIRLNLFRLAPLPRPLRAPDASAAGVGNPDFALLSTPRRRLDRPSARLLGRVLGLSLAASLCSLHVSIVVPAPGQSTHSPTTTYGVQLGVPAATAQSGDGWGVDGGADRRNEIIRRYRTILEARPDQGPIFDRLLQEIGGGQRFDSTVADYERLTAENPDRFAYPMLLGHLLRHAERLEPALEAYSRAIEIAPDDGRGYRSRASVYRALDQRPEAQADYEQALTLATDDDDRRDVLRELADLAFDAREWEVASAYVEQVLEIEDDAFTRMELAEIFIRYERFDDALAQYEAIIDRAGRDTRQRAIAIKDAGDVLAMMGRTEEALDRYESAMRLVDDGHWLVRELEQRIVAAYRQDDRLEELVETYEAEWTRPSLRQLNLLAELYDELGREDDALETYRQALRRDSRSIDTRLALIRLLERRGDMDEVVSQYQDLSRIDGNDASIRFRLVDVYRRIGRRDDAVAVLDAMSRQFGDRPHVLIDIADRYVRLGRAESALAAYERLVRIDPREPDNHIALGEFHFMAGRRSEAERHWRQVLELVTPEGQAHAMLGDVFSDHGLVEEAIFEYDRARALEPDDDTILRASAKLYEDAQRLAEALRLWESLAERTDQAHLRGEARGAMIRIYVALGTLQDVLPEYQARFDAEPPDIEAGYFLGQAWTALDDEAQAEAAFSAILEHAPDDLVALLALEELFTTQHRHEEAVAVLLRVAEAHPSRAREYYHRLSELSLRLYNDEQAVRFAELAVELNPDNAQAHARLADVHRQMQDLDAAVLAYRQALLLDPRAFSNYFDLAEIFLAQDRPFEADALYQHVLAEANDEVAVVRAGRRSIQINQARDTLEPLISIIEPHVYDDDLGEAYLKLLIELYERLTMPLSQRAAFGPVQERGAARDRLDDIGRRALRPLLDALAGEDVSLRRTALRILVAQGNPNAALPIARLLDASDADLRLEAALAVAVLADSRAAAPLLRAATSDSGVVQSLAAWALSRMDSPDLAPSLVELAEDAARPPLVRAFAVRGLGHMGEAGVPTANAMLFAESELIQVAAVMAVGELGLEERAADLILLLEHGSASVPLAAARALGALPATRATVAALLDAYVHGAPDIRTHAGDALSRLAAGASPTDTDAYDRSLVFYDRTVNALDGAAYFDGLLGWGLGEVTPATTNGLAAFDDVVLGALSRGVEADVATQRALLTSLNSEDDAGVSAIARALAGAARESHRALVEGWIADQADMLMELADGSDEQRSALALGVLAFGDRSAAPFLVSHFDDSNDAVAVAAIQAAGRLVLPDSGPLLSALNSPSWRRRSAAAMALGSGGFSDAVDELDARAQMETYASVRAAILDALLSLDPTVGVERTLALWEELPVAVRLALVQRAVELPAMSALVARARQDVDPRVRRAAMVGPE